MISTKQARDLLSGHNFIEFALLFGSFARGDPQPWSDVDIGIYVARPMSLFDVGRLTVELERALGRDVDLHVLNTALEHNPALAYKAVSQGTLLLCRDHKAFVDFKTRTILQYLDTAFLRATVSRSFQERLETGRFGKGG